MHPKEIENILKLNPFERYQYLFEKLLTGKLLI